MWEFYFEYNIVIVLGKEMDGDKKFTTDDVSKKAEGLGLIKPNPEVGCLIREMFTDEQIESMGLKRIVVMHDPIMVEGDGERIGLHSYDGGSLLDAYKVNPKGTWDGESGFVYLSPNK